eukprot:jgi/Ulvmu1/9483/UM052_0053.1
MSAATVERSLAIDAAIKACEHFAGEITSAIPVLAASSSACEELKMAAEALIACLPMVDITSKNSKFVEGVVCQIIEPDLQQTASYIRRIREKGPERAASSLRRRQDALEKRAERLWNCIGALSSAADGSDGLSRKSAPTQDNSPTAGNVDANADSGKLPPLPSVSSAQSSVRQTLRSKSHNDAAPRRPGSVPLGGPMSGIPHYPPKAPGSFCPPRSLQPLQTPHAYAAHLAPFYPTSPLAAFSHSSGTPAAMSAHLPFSPSPSLHTASYFAPPQCSSPAFCSAPLPGTSAPEPPMAAFLQSAADAARRFRQSNSLTPRNSNLRPRSTSPAKPANPVTNPSAYPEVFSPRSSQSGSAPLPVSAGAQGPLSGLDHTIDVARTAQEELSAELDRHDAMAAAGGGAPAEHEFEEQMRASASVIEAASRELEQRDAEIMFGETLRKAASAQDEMSREFDKHEESRAWDATLRAAASAQEDLSHELELRSSVAAPGGTSGSIGDAFGELERQVEEVSREMRAMPGVGGRSGKVGRWGCIKRSGELGEWGRDAVLGIEELDDFADESADVLAELGL